jgi:hypothetical protein
MKRVELQLIITEDNGKWYLKAQVPETSNTTLFVSGDSKAEILDWFARSMKEDNIKYWYLMSEI